MKKTKFLLPALTIASTAAIVTPFVTSCGLDWKPSASATHDVFSHGQYIGYTSTTKPADERVFPIRDKTLVSDYENFAKAVCQEIKTNGNGMLDDIMIDIVGSAQDICYFITDEFVEEIIPDDWSTNPKQNPNFARVAASTYDAASYKLLPDYYSSTFIFYLNFDLNMNLYDDGIATDDKGESHSGTIGFTIKCRNIPFMVTSRIEYGDPITICFYPMLLAFTSFSFLVNISANIDSLPAIAKTVEFTDYYQFLDEENYAIAYMLDWMLDNDKILYHFRNWKFNKQ